MANPSGAELEAMIRQRLANFLAPPPARAGSPPDDATQAVSSQVKQFDQIAAVTGRFVPATLVAGIDSDEMRREVLCRAADRYTVEPTAEGVEWVQSPAVRRDILKELGRAELGQLLHGDLPHTDRYGNLLREVLRDGDGVSLDRPAPDLVALKGVVDELTGTGLPAPAPDDLRRRIEANAFEREYLPADTHFVGRTAELRTLLEFLTRPKDPNAFPQWSGLILTGLGGAGKSSLLTHFMHDVYQKQLATLVVLDFDRPGIDPGDRAWLNAEAARQVALQFPESGAELRARRHQARQTFAQSASQRTDFESAAIERSTDDLLDAIRQALEKAGVAARPFFLVLDTLEQVAEDAKREALREWLNAVGSFLWQTPVKVVLSGRLYDSSLAAFRGWVGGEPTELKELSVPVAERLLEKSGLSRPLAATLARSTRLPRRPLELRLLARLAQIYSSPAELEKALRAGKTPVSAGVIYRRVLQRLGSDVVGKLASPGLVLRYVTPEIIESVLAPALDLPELNGPAAKTALDKLATHAWLVTRDTHGRVWHRRDLRQSMLQLMLAEERQTAERISRAAVDFFAAGSSRDDRAEAVYHRLLLVRDPEDGAAFDLGELKDAYDSINPDIDDLQPPAAAVLRFAAQKGITPADVEQLPSVYFDRAYNKTGRRLVRAREFGQAARLMHRWWARPGHSSDAGVPRLDWEWDVLFATSDWATMRDALYGPDETWLTLVKEVYHRTILGLRSKRTPRTLLPQAVKAVGEATPGSAIVADATAAISWLAVALVIDHAASPLSRKDRSLVAKLVARAEDLEPKRLRALLHHRIFLLGLLAGRRSGVQFRPAPSLVPLRPGALRELAGLPKLRAVSGLLEAAADRLQGRDRQLPTAQNTLARIDALYKHESEWDAAAFLPARNADPTTATLLRGPDPDFRDPIRYCMRDEFGSARARRQLASILQDVLTDIPLTELRPDACAGALALDAEHALEAPVELVDRAWRTRQLLNALCAARPKSERLKWIRKAYRRWDGAVESLLASHFPNRRKGYSWRRT